MVSIYRSCCLILFLLLLDPVFGAGGQTENKYKVSQPNLGVNRINLIKDPSFRLGFKLIAPAPGKKTVIGNIQPPDVKEPPHWYLCQWNSLHCLSNAPIVTMPSGMLKIENKAKIIMFGQGSRHDSDLILGVDSRREYPDGMRKKGQLWPHLLIEQDDIDIHLFGCIRRIRLQVEARLLKSEHFELDGYTPNLHTAQFLLTLIIQNRNRESAGYGDLIWFNVQIYAERYRSSPLYAAKDTADPSAKMIYAPPTHVYTDASLHDGHWVKFDKGLYPFIQEALSEARRKGYLQTSPSNNDFAISSVILGWEVPGISSVQMQVRDLSLVISLRP